MQHGVWKADDIRRMASQGGLVNGEANPGLERRYKKWNELHRMMRELDRLRCCDPNCNIALNSQQEKPASGGNYGSKGMHSCQDMRKSRSLLRCS